MSTSLIFSAAPTTGLPVHLVFGDEPTADIPSVAVYVEGVFDLVADDVFDLTGAVAFEYVSGAERPDVGEVRSVYQGAAASQEPMRGVWQDSTPLVPHWQSRWQDADPVESPTDLRWQDQERLRSDSTSHYQEAAPLQTTLGSEFQDQIRLRNDAWARFQEALGIQSARTTKFQDTLNDRRNSTAGRFQEAVGYWNSILEGYQDALPFGALLAGRYQEAMPPPAGIWVRPPVPGPDPCYLPSLPVHLVFSEAHVDAAHLVFICERHGGPTPGGTVVVPIKEVYLVINSAVLIRVEGAVPIPTLSMSMSLDVDSWTWSFSASVPGYALADIEPEDGVPVDVQATINGTPYRFIVESISRERTFGRSDLRIGGRGRAAVLDAPYAPIMSFGNEFGRTAEQLMNDILTDNGVPLGWDVEWNPDDWNVPAGVFSHQGSYITALNQVAGSISAYLQPHNTDEVLRVLSRYPVAPWDWAGVTPDFELPSAVMSRESIEWRDKARYNRVYVMGQQVGVNGRVTREGTAGDYLAPTIIDPLITEAVAARQRGIAVLSDTGRIATVGLRLPVLAETGIIAPGSFVRYLDGGIERIGLTRSVQVEVGLPSIWQTLGVETHVEPV
ncbi:MULTISPECIES: hypothetical protein [unclassified Pseudoalteromonas]|nr:MULTISPECIES: hypothetical protein [unclassified Pseudoalteromonas]MBQ5557901.1 hypothetical protein [Aeriscardovia sp.]MBQ9003022.1 hypothetical protein [Eggerthellaceae bacterium]MBR2407089.1 hypothetical protein [Clostridia bacterium]MBH0013650.1 hypothetical protein [Pseudoalteromonas sp. NZS100_1]MBH0032950.1 hypothetical protein [Pseudoalteromonas sp. SWYJZ98]